MPIPRLQHGLQNVTQFFRLVCAWCFCVGVAVVYILGIPFLGAEQMWLRLRLPWARTVLRLLRVRLDVRGTEHLRGPAVFIANHLSFIDVVILPALVPRECRLVAKREVLYFPLVGWAFAAGGALLVDRRNPRLAAKRLLAAVRKLPKGWSLQVFPEGTRSRTGEMAPFKPAIASMASMAGCPIVPAYLSGTYEALPKGGGMLPRVRRIGAAVGPAIPAAFLADWARGLSRHEAYRHATALVELAVQSLAHGEALAPEALRRRYEAQQPAWGVEGLPASLGGEAGAGRRTAIVAGRHPGASNQDGGPGPLRGIA